MQQNSCSWVKVQADNYEATVSLKAILAHPCSQIASLLEFQSSKGGEPSVRLDCSGEVAREVVAVLRQGSSYDPPEDPRLLRALQQQLDFLGVPAPSVPQRVESQEIVLVPSYWYLGLNMRLSPVEEPLSAGLLMYSGGAFGWANRTGAQDPRPSDVRGCDHPHSGGGCWLASVLRSEATGAGEDLVYMVPNKIQPPQRYGDTAVVLHTRGLSCSRTAMPPVHKRMGFSDSAMAAAQGKLWLLGGSCHREVPPATPFEVYDPHLDSWFAAPSPIPGPVSLSEHALVANQQEGVLLTLGGCLTSGDHRGRHRQTRMNEAVALFDVRSGRWQPAPGGCKWAGAGTSCSVSAVAVDAYTIMVLSMDNRGQSVRTELLDLRTWSWRPAASLQQQQQAADGAGDEDECLLNMGTVLYDGKVLAIGGRHRFKAGEWASCKAHAYDLLTDTWSELPCELPFPICHASPVAVRVPSVLSELMAA